MDLHRNGNNRRGFCSGSGCISGTTEGPGFGWSVVVRCSWGLSPSGPEQMSLPEARKSRECGRGLGRVRCEKSQTGIGWRPAGQEQNSHGCENHSYCISIIFLLKNEMSVVKIIEKQLSGLQSSRGSKSWALPWIKSARSNRNKL